MRWLASVALPALGMRVLRLLSVLCNIFSPAVVALDFLDVCLVRAIVSIALLNDFVAGVTKYFDESAKGYRVQEAVQERIIRMGTRGEGEVHYGAWNTSERRESCGAESRVHKYAVRILNIKHKD
jgi:hypothetical protein